MNIRPLKSAHELPALADMLAKTYPGNYAN